jgi:hypothetical protein
LYFTKYYCGIKAKTDGEQDIYRANKGEKCIQNLVGKREGTDHVGDTGGDGRTEKLDARI